MSGRSASLDWLAPAADPTDLPEAEPWRSLT
jgi:hypothetical protein